AAVDIIIVQGMNALDFIGAHEFGTLPGRKIIDLHDNMPVRDTRLRAAVWRRVKRAGLNGFRALQREELIAALQIRGAETGMRREIDQLRFFDTVLISTDEERDIYIAAGLPAERCLRWRWGLDIAPRGGSTPAPTETFDIGFLGSVNLFNIEALEHFNAEII